MRRDPAKVLIPTERLVLRLPKHGDEEAMAGYYRDNRDYLQPYYPSFDPAIFTARAWRDRIGSTLAEYRGKRGMRLVLFREGQVVGIANFTSVTGFPTHMCNLGYSLAETAQRHGLMREALTAAIPFSLRHFNLHRIEANFMPSNLRSRRLLKELGFVEEGCATEYLLIDGRWEDHVRTSLTNVKWLMVDG